MTENIIPESPGADKLLTFAELRKRMDACLQVCRDTVDLIESEPGPPDAYGLRLNTLCAKARAAIALCCTEKSDCRAGRARRRIAEDSYGAEAIDVVAGKLLEELNR